MVETTTTINWLYSLPCVQDGRVIIDVRNAWPMAIIGMRAKSIETREDFFVFILDNLD